MGISGLIYKLKKKILQAKFLQEPSEAAIGNDAENNSNDVDDTEHSIRDDFNISAGSPLIIIESILNIQKTISKVENLLYEQFKANRETKNQTVENDKIWMWQAYLADLKKTLTYFKVSGDVTMTAEVPIRWSRRLILFILIFTIFTIKLHNFV